MAKKFPLEVELTAIDSVTAPLRRVNKRIEGIFGPVSRLNARLGATMRDLARESHLDRVGAGFLGVGRGVRGVTREVGVLAAKVGGLVAIGGGAAYALVRSFATSGDEIAKTASKLGIGIGALQEYRFAADRSGIEQTAFDNSIQRLGRNVAEAAAGMGPARDALEALGLSARDSGGQVKSVEDLLPELADSLGQVENVSVRNALAFRLFGREGVGMSNLLKEGSRGMADLRSQARELGLVMSDDAAKGSEKFVDSQTNLMSAMKGVKNTIGAALMPTVQGLVDRLKVLLVDRREDIRAFADEFARQLPERLEQLKELFSRLVARMEPVIDTGRRIIERFGGLKFVLGALVAVILGPTLAALATLLGSILALGGAVLSVAVTAFGALFSVLAGVATAILALPIGWMLAAFAAIAAGAVAIVKYWEPIKAFFAGLWDGVKASFADALDWILDKVRGLVDFLPDFVSESLGLDNLSASLTTVETQVIKPAPEPVSQDPVPTDLATRAFSPETLRALAQFQEPSGPRDQPQAGVLVRFEGLPPGARVDRERNSGVDLDLDLGFAVPGV